MNQALHQLRHARLLAVLLLGWFGLFVTMAAAAPLMKAGPTAVLCSASGIINGLGSSESAPAGKAQHSIDCMLCCFTADTPTPPLRWAQPALPVGHVLQSIPAARIAVITAAPLPPRGPPHAS